LFLAADSQRPDLIPMPPFQCGRFNFSLAQPLVMGIVNVTPDSFSDGGRYFSPERAIEHALRLKQEGAHILDIGGESTRPGSAPVSVEDELKRVLPVVEGLRGVDVAISVDTMKPEVMAAVLAAGADMINDVRGFEAPSALAAVASANCGLCFMHMRGMPKTMQDGPAYVDVIEDVTGYLRQRLSAAKAAGIVPDRMLIDPGFGFGKTLEHNLTLFKNLGRLADIAPVLVGVSRKSFLGALTGRVDASTAADRLLPSVISAVLAIQAGAAIVRVHDVRETVEAIGLLQALGERPFGEQE
jgi:dihydropteroate synthase